MPIVGTALSACSSSRRMSGSLWSRYFVSEQKVHGKIARSLSFQSGPPAGGSDHRLPPPSPRCAREIHWLNPGLSEAPHGRCAPPTGRCAAHEARCHAGSAALMLIGLRPHTWRPLKTALAHDSRFVLPGSVQNSRWAARRCGPDRSRTAHTGRSSALAGRGFRLKRQPVASVSITANAPAELMLTRRRPVALKRASNSLSSRSLPPVMASMFMSIRAASPGRPTSPTR